MGKIADAYRKETGYTGNIGWSMTPEQWNDYCKFASKWRNARPEHITELKERKEKRRQKSIEREKLRKLNGDKYKKYCKNYQDIENFYEAQKDDFKGWICHHKLEQMFTAEQLRKMNIYYDCKPGELIFLRISEHNNNAKLHYGCRIRDKSKCGRHRKNV